MLKNISISAGQIKRFRFDFKEKDQLITYSPENRIYLIGEIIGDYKWDQKILIFDFCIFIY